MPENVKCNICKSSRKALLLAAGKFGIVKCRGCGLVYTSPRPTEMESSRLYEDFNANYDSRALKAWEETARRRLVELMKLKKTGVMLELGCSIGYFINEARKRGFECYGIDASRNALKIAKKLYRLKNVSSTDKYMNYREKFDIIAAYHVLEHMRDPMSTLEKLSSSMKKDGLMVLEVPDAGSLKPKILKSKWAAYDVFRHLYYFDHKSLSRMLAANNLRIIKKSTMSNILLSEFGAKQAAAVRSLPAGTKDILSRASLYATFLMKKAGIGDAIRVYAVKN